MRIRKIGTSVPLPSGQVIDSLNGSSTTNAPSIRAVNEGLQDIYSTNEVKTNKIWIDNKPIYRKVFVENNVATGYTDHQHGISTLETLIKAEGILYYTLGYQYVPNVVSDNITGYGAGILNTTNKKYSTLLGTSIPTTNKLYVILEYTKTTD